MLSKLLHRFQRNLHNDRDHQDLVVGGPNRRQTNPRWRTAAILKTVKSPYELTYRSDATTDFHAWWLKRRGLAQTRMCLLGVSLTLLPILGVKSPENPNFGGVNRRFQAKRGKYWKFHVIETTASISTKFCTTIETIKNSSWVVPIGAQQL